MSSDKFKPRARRLPVQIPVTYSTLSVFLDSEIMNLSKGGVFIRADITLPLGSEIDFQFTLPKTNRIIQATGVVIWARKAGKGGKSSFPDHVAGMGVQFKDFPVQDLDLILEQIEKLVQNSQ